MSNISYIKTNADVKAILAYFNVDINLDGDTMRARCPIHGGNNITSFAISERGVWYCHTKCKRGGDIINLVQELQESTFYAACETIARLSGFTLDGVKFTKEEISAYEEANLWFGAYKKPYVFKTYDIDCQETFPVEKYRNLDKNTLEAANVFYSRSFNLTNGTTHNRIGFPIVFKGQVIGVDLRATKITDTIKWLRQPKGLSVGHALYNYDSIIKDDATFVVLVEGITDALTLIQYGYPALCTFGASITKEQAILLENLCVEIYIAYDGDMAGRKGVNSIYKTLSKTCTLKYIELQDGKDPGDTSPEEFDLLFEQAKTMRGAI